MLGFIVFVVSAGLVIIVWVMVVFISPYRMAVAEAKRAELKTVIKNSNMICCVYKKRFKYLSMG